MVEDAAHAAESRYRGRKVGGISDATCFSLYATKNIAAGEGGLVATNRDDVAAAIRDMRLTRRGDGSHYDQVTRRIQGEPLRRPRGDRARPARPGRAHARIRERQFALYDEGLAELDGHHAARPRPPRHARPAPVRRPHRRLARRRHPRRLPAGLADELIGTSIHFLPVHRLTWFRERYPAQPPLPVAERAGDEVLSLPLSPAHSDDDILDAIDAVRRVHARFTA